MNAERITISDGNGNSVVTTAENMSKVAKLVDSSLIQSIYEGSKEVYRDYEVTLTDAELVKVLEETAALSAEIDADKFELESLKTTANTLRKAIEEKLDNLSYKLFMSRSKKTRREIACYEVFDWDTDTVLYINVDTGEEMERLPIPEYRKQGKLEFEPQTEQEEQWFDFILNYEMIVPQVTKKRLEAIKYELMTNESVLQYITDLGSAGCDKACTDAIVHKIYNIAKSILQERGLI